VAYVTWQAESEEDAVSMPGSSRELDVFAHMISQAYISKQSVPPLVESCPSLTIDDAYVIQQIQVDDRIRAGAVVKGYKVGLTSQAMRDQFGIDQPDCGFLFDDMFHPEHMPIDTAAFLQPKIEPEIAFVMGKALMGPGVNAAQAIQAVDFVLPSLELIDSRVRDWRVTIVDTIADNASAAGVILGSRPTRLADCDLAKVQCRMVVDGRLPSSGVGADVMGTPVNALVWLVNTLGARGTGFQPGDVIMPGAIVASCPVTAGITVSAWFDGLGDVTAEFI